MDWNVKYHIFKSVSKYEHEGYPMYNRENKDSINTQSNWKKRQTKTPAFSRSPSYQGLNPNVKC